MRRDEFWIWAAGIAGAIISGLIISAFITDFAAGDIAKIYALIVALVCFGISPILWAADELGGWSINGGDEE